jgi:hypothetical protein
MPKWSHSPSSPSADDKTWPTNLIKIIRAIKQPPPNVRLHLNSRLTSHPRQSRKKYLTLRRKYKGSLAASLEAQQDSTVGYGLKFWDVDILTKIFGRHPYWLRMSQILTNGSEWPIEPLGKERRLKDVDKALTFGNHKGASLQPDLLRKLVTKDVQFGYCPTLPVGKAKNTPGILIAPMNIQKQNTINEHGRIIEKDHLTHDQSFKWSSGTSVNNQT